MTTVNKPVSAINPPKARGKQQPKAPRVNKKPKVKKNKPKFMQMSRGNALAPSKSRIERPFRGSQAEVRDYIKGLVTALLSTTDMSPGEGIRVPRITSRPVAARKLPFSFKIPLSAFPSGKLQLRFAPDLYRTLSYTVENAASIKPDADSIWRDQDYTLPRNAVCCLNPDIHVGNGSTIKFDTVMLDTSTRFFTTNYNTSSPIIGAEALLFGSIFVNTDHAVKWTPRVTNYNGEEIDVVATIYAIGAPNALGKRTILARLDTPSFSVPHNESVSGAFSDAQWTTFATLINSNSDIRGLVFAYDITVGDNSDISSVITGLEWTDNKPELTGSSNWQVVSIWDALGEAGTVLKAEIDNVQFGAVTQLNVRVSDFVANLNKNGTISATQLPACKLKAIPTDVDGAIVAIDNIGIPEYSWKSLPEPDGITWVAHFDSQEQWFRRPSKYLLNRGSNLDDVDLPIAVMATDFSANMTPGTNHVIKIMGSLNYEWETTSLAFDLNFPPSNYTRFNEAYFQAITKECPFTHNPSHVPEIAKKIANVIKHPLMQHVMKTLLDVGLAAMTSL